MFAKVKERKDSAFRSGGSNAGSGGGSAAGGADRTMPSIISRDMVVTGDLATPGEVHVEGIIHGDVRCAKLIIGATGTVHGLVEAGTVRVHGRVEGEIDADEVYLLNGSIVQGDIVQTLLEVAPGAAFEGAVRRRQPGVARQPGPAAMLAPPVVVPAETEKAEPAAQDSTGEGVVTDTAAKPVTGPSDAVPDVATPDIADKAPTSEVPAPAGEVPAAEEKAAEEKVAGDGDEAASVAEKPARSAKAG